MIGGTVIETLRVGDRVYVNTVDDDEKRNDKCAIYVEHNENSDRIKPGDSVWWQGSFAMWTPWQNRACNRIKTTDFTPLRCGIDFDIKIPRIGFSGVKRPQTQKA